MAITVTAAEETARTDATSETVTTDKDTTKTETTEGWKMSEKVESVFEELKPTGGKLLYALAGGLIDRFGVSYVMQKYREFKAKENEELAKKIAEMLKDYKKE